MIRDPVEFAAVLSSLIVLSMVAVRLKAIDRPGQVVGVAISTLIYLGGGLAWVILVTSFFVVGSTFTRWRYSTKKRLGMIPDKNGVRSWPNILANGGFGASLAVLEGTLGGAVFAIAFLGSLATAAADTLATEIGVMSRRNPRLVTNLGKIVTPGSSGGVTTLGTSVAAVSAMFYGLAGTFLGIGDSKMLIVIAAATVGGFSGALLDSVMGATLQGIYRCGDCGREVETPVHHGQAAVRIRGAAIIDNNVVNLVSIVFGGLLTVGFFFLFESLLGNPI